MFNFELLGYKYKFFRELLMRNNKAMSLNELRKVLKLKKTKISEIENSSVKKVPQYFLMALAINFDKTKNIKKFIRECEESLNFAYKKRKFPENIDKNEVEMIKEFIKLYAPLLDPKDLDYARLDLPLNKELPEFVFKVDEQETLKLENKKSKIIKPKIPIPSNLKKEKVIKKESYKKKNVEINIMENRIVSFDIFVEIKDGKMILSERPLSKNSKRLCGASEADPEKYCGVLELI